MAKEHQIAFGCAGKILHVDLTTGHLDVEEPPEERYRTYLGGNALGLHCLLGNTPAGADLYRPENTLAFILSGVTGEPVAGQSRCTAFAKSPLTGLSKTFSARHQERVDADQELIALGAANAAGGLFGAFVTNASNSRSAAADASRTEDPSLQPCSGRSPCPDPAPTHPTVHGSPRGRVGSDRESRGRGAAPIRVDQSSVGPQPRRLLGGRSDASGCSSVRRSEARRFG